MKEIGLVSDLHLDFNPRLELPGGDILCVAGDIAEVRNLEDPEVKESFERNCAKYRRVFAIMGNHEHYSSIFHNTRTLVERELPKNVMLMEKEATNISPDWMIFGATLWTDIGGLDRDCWDIHAEVRKGMADFEMIHIADEHTHKVRKLSTYDVRMEFKRTMDILREKLESYRGKNFVVMTHHAPSFKSVHPRYKPFWKLNCGYASILDDFIENHPQIKFWVHGHMHAQADYMVGQCRVICNPRGYANSKDDGAPENISFQPGLTFELGEDGEEAMHASVAPSGDGIGKP